jgi:hypothetical protein
VTVKDWDKELAKIDRQLGSLTDEALLPAPAGKEGRPAASAAAASPATGRLGGVLLRVGLVTALGVGMVFWPYSTRCGAGLLAYLAAVGVLVAGGAWSAAASWRQRIGWAHVVSLTAMLWGGALAAREILPRVGYAIPTEAHPAIWGCN